MSNYPPGVTVFDIDRWFGDVDDDEDTPNCRHCEDIPIHPVTGDVCGICTTEEEA